jgi:hypothetical protein
MAADSTPAGSDGGVSAHHDDAPTLAPLVAATTEAKSNLLRAPLRPIACWRVDDVRFDFALSFVRPDIKDEMSLLEALLKQHAGSPVSLFGHADPVGQDDYNKTLSGRRATAIYATLTRRADLWEKLYSSPEGADKWGDPALQTMLDTTTDPSTADSSTDGSSGDPLAPYRSDAGKRQQLYKSYMDKLCGSLVLQKTDFLGGGQDSGGKADYQGCGEFNPLVILSSQYNNASDEDQKAARNAANAPNRRVLLLLFPKGSSVDPTRWPCPRASEGAGGCRARFWSDGEKRRSTQLPDQSRKYDQTHDTFACRFYDRLVDASPCEQAPVPLLFRFVSEATREPIKQAKVCIKSPSGATQNYTTDDQGQILLMGHPGTQYSVTQITSPSTSTVSSVERATLTPDA